MPNAVLQLLNNAAVALATPSNQTAQQPPRATPAARTDQPVDRLPGGRYGSPCSAPEYVWTEVERAALEAILQTDGIR